ncbi:MAG: hypothetical protein HKN33_18375 [Pyrinomonadaceae bacterium]|nr:hypothetical protein [Pyrinomonadaceae bacterium]
MKLGTLFSIVIASLLLASPLAAQNKHDVAKRIQETAKKLAPIRAYVKSVQKDVQKKGVPDTVVADISDYNNSEKPEWKTYESAHAYETDERESYTTAFIWKKEGRITQVNFTYSSPSGDWAQYVFHTYYPNGKAAKIDRELRTFLGDVIVNRVSYYDKKGKAVAENVTYRDLETKKLIRKPESFMDMEAEIYMNSSDLPFSK